MAHPSKTAIARKPAKTLAVKPATASKAKKAPTAKKMIKVAIVALKERIGSSPYVIMKFTEVKHKDLSMNIKNLLSIQLKNLVTLGKLTKVKNLFKLGTSK
ncbi:hypothetical protein ACH5RR_039645 [Cinchona calisaya]|uniref:H15 domain-containing protein n=1 Tax=Cinchona calisaya TaxID=153742 RepID=A0ABD2Y3W7_9GENT